MGNYRYIPEPQKELVLTMSLRGMKVKDIVDATGMCKRTVCRVRSTWKATGKVVRKPLHTGRPRKLTALHISYLESMIERQPDIYAKDLRDALVKVYDVDVSESTITRTLSRRGITRKMMTRPDA
ncbi:hypothetical protein CVT26_001270 [Gymnopilus dilepis]|uniref:Transposase Tc1-like domain-containing protein n=1 Tax=Gymnopilus dilepis TaxID=231916 RepID=A0A409Y206_9AGAR|nr:hypothetical protein CVT26_001270 [Gymnopilus dilepis]